MKTQYKIASIVLIIALILLEKYLFLNHLNFSELFTKSLIDEGLTPEQVNTTLSYQKWLVPVSIVLTMLSVLIISGLLYLGCLLLSYPKNFKKIFLVVFLCESIIIISKLANFIVLKMNLEHFQTIEHLKRFQTLSLQFLSPYNFATEGIYSALGAINLFQAAYWFALTYGLKFIINKPYWKTFEVVLYSYISIYIFYVLGKLLFTISFN